MSEKNDKSKPIETNAETDIDAPSRNRKTAEDAAKNPDLQWRQEKKSLPYNQDDNDDDKGDRGKEDPTRFGDWTKNGRAIDF